MAVLAVGSGPDGSNWELEVSGDQQELSTTVSTTLADGRKLWGGGCGGPAVYSGRRASICTGSGDEGPRTFIVRASPDIRAVVLSLSDGTREDLVLHGDSNQLGARVGVLVYQRDLDIHRVDLVGHDGTLLPDRF